MLMLWMYLHLITVFIPAYFFPFSKKNETNIPNLLTQKSERRYIFKE